LSKKYGQYITVTITIDTVDQMHVLGIISGYLLSK